MDRNSGYASTLLLLALASGLASCTRAPGPEELAGRYLEELMEQQRWERWDAIMAPDARVNGNALGRHLVVGTADGLHRAFPDLVLDVRERLTDDDSAVVTFEIEGTHQGSFGLLRATGRAVNIPGVVIVREAGGRITEVTQVIDYWHAVEQITAPSVASR
jgi:predicted ester cyclase